MRLLLIRHGETASNAEARVQGHLDVPLTERGVREGKLLAARLAEFSVAALYSSSLQRARRTAEMIASRLGLEIEERPALMERDVGALEGLTREEIIARFPEFLRARADPLAEIDVAGYESDDDFAQRVMPVLEEIIQGHPQETAAVITHGGVIAAFCRHVLQIPAVRPAPFDIHNGSITMFDVHEGEFEARMRTRVQLIALNDTCHLDVLR